MRFANFLKPSTTPMFSRADLWAIVANQIESARRFETSVGGTVAQASGQKVDRF